MDSFEAEGAEGVGGEDIDAEDSEVFTGVVGEGNDAFDLAGGGADAGLFCEGGPEGFGDVAADFELGFAGDEIDAGGEGAVGAVIGDLDRDVDGDSEGDAEDVEKAYLARIKDIRPDLLPQAADYDSAMRSRLDAAE